MTYRRASACAGWLCVVAAVGCADRARYAQMAVLPAGYDAGIPVDATTPVQDAGTSPECPATLAERLSSTDIDVDADIRYRAATRESFPMDERVGFSVAPNGQAYVAWLDVNDTRVHVTPLSAALERAGPDRIVPGEGLGGLIAHNDGYALLTRRDDPGEPLTSQTLPGEASKAAFLVRVRNNAEAFSVPLTGTASITSAQDPRARDCTPLFMYGRLAWNGSKYGAYFLVNGCDGDPHGSRGGDKLVYVNANGELVAGGQSWRCTQNPGLRLVAGPNVFTPLCLSDTTPFPGLDLVVEGLAPRQLVPDAVDMGYTTGQFGSIIKLADGGYAIGWLYRGTVNTGSRLANAKRAQDIALLRLDRDYATVAPLKWLSDTPDVAETNLHLAPYGPERMLVVWDAVENLRCTNLSCFGDYTGTHARLSDLDGNFLTPDATIDAVPNTSEDLAIFPNGDVGWAFVPEPERTYTTAVSSSTRLPSKRRISVARMRLCQ